MVGKFSQFSPVTIAANTISQTDHDKEKKIERKKKSTHGQIHGSVKFGQVTFLNVTFTRGIKGLCLLGFFLTFVWKYQKKTAL